MTNGPFVRLLLVSGFFFLMTVIFPCGAGPGQCGIQYISYLSLLGIAFSVFCLTAWGKGVLERIGLAKFGSKIIVEVAILIVSCVAIALLLASVYL